MITIYILLLLITILYVSVIYAHRKNIKKYIAKHKQKILGGLVVVSTGIAGMSGFMLTPSSPPDNPENEWIIDGDIVYVNDSNLYASASPHTIYGSDEVMFEFESKEYSGDVDLAWGFNQEIMRPSDIWLWQNFSHPNSYNIEQEDYGCVTLYNITNYTSLGIENYSSYNVYLGNRNNSYLYNITVDGNLSRVYAFSSPSPPYPDPPISSVELCGNYNKTIKVWDNQSFFDWKKWDVDYNHVQWNHENTTDWYITPSQSIQQGVRYKCKIHVEQQKIQLGEMSGKYWFAFKPSSENLSQAINNRHLYVLDPWYNSNWGYRKEITINSSQVPSDLTNFPVLINLSSDSDLVSHAQTDGDDILFTNDTGTKLNHEIESWNNTGNGDLVAWVNVTSLSHDTDTDIYMYYGNSGASNQENPEDVWDSNYVAVWHMDESSGNIIDSSGTIADHSFSGSLPDKRDGVIDGCQDFDGTCDYIDFGDESATEVSNPTLTAWVKTDDYTDSLNGAITRGNVFGATHEYSYKMDFHSGNARFSVTDALNNGYSTGHLAISDNKWHMYALVYDGSNVISYKDSSRNVGDSFSGSIDYTKTCDSFVISEETCDYEFAGRMDEIRLSSIARSDDWINTEYNSMNNATNGGFFSLGSEETSNNAPSFSGWQPTGIDQNLQPTANVTINDIDGDNTVVDWYISTDNTTWGSPSRHVATHTANTSDSYTVSEASSYNTKYYAKVTANDGTDNSTQYWNFTTKTCPWESGSGTEADPYDIDSIEDLYAVREQLDKYFILTADLDFDSDASYEDTGHKSGNTTGDGWLPIGDDTDKFTGDFNGDNYTISNLFISRSSTDYIGLFGYHNGNINNLGLDSVDITGENYVGGIAGMSKSDISYCYVTGSVSSGELVCYAGGFVGYSGSGSNNSYSWTNVSVTGDYYTGGFLGINDNSETYRCFSFGTVTADHGNAFASDGAGSTETQCFYDNETAGVSDLSDATGKYTSDMKTLSTFTDAGWDMVYSTVDMNNGYPYLAWQNNTDSNTWLIYEEPPTIYNTTVRNDGIDYFVWLGGNTTASVVDNNITGFDEASEYIGIWNMSYNSSEEKIITNSGSGGDTYIFDTQIQAQTFKYETSMIVSGVNLTLKDYGSPGEVNVTIREMSGGHPVYSNNLTWGHVVTDGSYTTKNIVFDHTVVLDANTEYCVMVEACDASYPSEYVYWRLGNNYVDGNREYSTNGGSSWTSGTDDLIFSIYGKKQIFDWDYYYGDTTGNDWSINTFDVVQVYLTDSGTQTFNMTENSDMDYTKSYSYTWTNTSVNKGYNYTGYNKEASTTLSAINTSVTLQVGEAIALWNETNYEWDWWLPKYYETDKNVHRWDVILSKVENSEVWNT